MVRLCDILCFSTEIIGGVMRIYVECMDQRGFRAVNYSVYFD